MPLPQRRVSVAAQDCGNHGGPEVSTSDPVPSYDFIARRLRESIDLRRRVCPVCDHHHRNGWAGGTFHNIPSNGDGMVNPVVMVECETCGYTLTFNAIRLGIVNKYGDSLEPREGCR